MDTLMQRLRSVVGAKPAPDVVRQLRAEHQEIRQLFNLYDDLIVAAASAPERQELAARICLALALHAVVEEEVIYPAARQWSACRRWVAEAEMEHAAARTLIDELALMEPDDLRFDAHISVLGTCVLQHFAEEEARLLPLLARVVDDLPGLAAQARRHRQVLQQELDAMVVGGASHCAV
jgi:hemerythrin superfamily protein